MRPRSRARESDRCSTVARGIAVAVLLLGILALVGSTPEVTLPGRGVLGLGHLMAGGAYDEPAQRVAALGLVLGLTVVSLGVFFLGGSAASRSRAERATSESEARMAAMIDSAMDAVVSVDDAQRIVLFNAAAEKMFGRTAAEVIGQPLDLLIPERLRAAHREHIRAFGTAAVTSRSMRALGALSGLRADGQEFPIEASISRVDVSGERIYTAIVRDISERQRAETALRDSEERLRLALDATGLGIWSLDLRTGVRRWSARSKALFGLALGAEVDEDVVRSCIHPADWPRLGEALKRALRPGSSGEIEVEFRISRAADGEERWLHSRGRVFVEDGQPVRLVGSMLDITQRRRAEEAVRDSEGRYRTLFEWAPDGIVIADRQSNYTSANASMCRMLGYSLEELIGKHASDIVVQDEVEHIGPALATINAGADHHRHWRFRRKDGSTFHAEVRATAMPDGSVIGMIRDVTERRDAERALRESEERFRTMANSMSQLAWIARPDGFIHWYNERWYEYTGTRPEEMAAGGWQIVHDPAVLPSVVSRWSEAVAAGEVLEMEVPLRGADGRFRTFLTRVQPLKDAEGRVIQWFGTNTDVEALKQAEERVQRLNAELEERVVERTAQLEAAIGELSESRAELQGLFESLPGLYLVLTPELDIVAASDAYLAATMTTREAIVGRQLFDVFQDNPDAPDVQGVAALRASLDRVIRDRKPNMMAIQRYDVRRQDGVFEERYWSPVNSPMFGADRRLKYIIHRVEDVTDFIRRRAQHPGAAAEPDARLQQMEAEVFHSAQMLQAANLQLEAANKELEAFSYSVSHDLRAPLRGVDGYVRILQEDHGHRLDAEGHRLLDVVSAQAKRMGQLIDDLLEFSRLGRTPMRRRQVEMTELARAAFEAQTAASPERAPRLELDALPPAQGDRAMLRQVFANLIGNAIKFSRNRPEPVIEVGWSRNAERAPGEVVYHVRDNGAGFDERYGHKLFGVFQRLHSEQEFEGTGVGLALVHRIVVRHGGAIWAEGRPGIGAAFFFTLPAPTEEDP